MAGEVAPRPRAGQDLPIDPHPHGPSHPESADHPSDDARVGASDRVVEVVDGGDRGCGELLLVLAARSRSLPPASTVRLLASDPAAPLDLPAWCHLTGHTYLGQGTEHDGRRYYDIRLAEAPRTTEHDQPWRLDPEEPTDHREEHP